MILAALAVVIHIIGMSSSKDQRSCLVEQRRRRTSLLSVEQNRSVGFEADDGCVICGVCYVSGRTVMVVVVVMLLLCLMPLLLPAPYRVI